MLSTQDFAHEVWQSLENIRERLAVLETEVRHTRHDLLRLENTLVSHTMGHGHPPPHGGSPARSGGNDGDNSGAVVNIRLSRRALGGGGVVGGGLVAAIVGIGKALGWW